MPMEHNDDVDGIIHVADQNPAGVEPGDKVDPQMPILINDNVDDNDDSSDDDSDDEDGAPPATRRHSSRTTKGKPPTQYEEELAHVLVDFDERQNVTPMTESETEMFIIHVILNSNSVFTEGRNQEVWTARQRRCDKRIKAATRHANFLPG